MSHFSKLAKSNIIDVKAFVAAMKELGFTNIKENTTIKDYVGKTMKVDVAVDCGRYSIGLVKNESGKYDMVSDWWGIRTRCKLPPEFIKACKVQNMSDQDIQDCLLRYTTKHTLVNKYKKLGYQCVTKEDNDGKLQITMNKF